MLPEKEKNPLGLPEGFEWREVDILNKKQLKRLYQFLRDNYVEDDDNMFRFDYSPAFLKWHLTAPGWKKLWHLSIVKVNKDGSETLSGFISAIPVTIFIDNQPVKKVEINFLCVKQELRAHKVAMVLIQEITRRTHTQGIWQAVYTAGVLLTKPISKATYYHRNLNVSKLVDIKFTYLPRQMDMTKAKQVYAVAKEPTIDGVRPMTENDVKAVFSIMEKYLSQFRVRSHYDEEEVAHWFLPRDEVVFSYVVETEGEVTDFFSFYSLPSSVLQHEKHTRLNAAYSFFNIPGKHSLKTLVRNSLIMAKKKKFDVFNALNVMENETVFGDLLFGKGDGTLKYYLYNYAFPSIEPKDIGIVLM